MTSLLKEYEGALLRRQHYDEVIAQRKGLLAVASTELQNAVHNLERRGLLQYDRATKRHDLHPVVRAVSAGRLAQEEKHQLGQRVVDYFSQQAENPYEQAETLEDFGKARRIVNALFHMGALERAKEFIDRSGFLRMMGYRLEAYNEVLAIIRPFFTEGWSEIPAILQSQGRRLVRTAAVALRRVDQLDDAFILMQADLCLALGRSPPEAPGYQQFLDLASTAGDQYRFALEERLIGFAKDCAWPWEPNSAISVSMARFRQLSRLGRWSEADALWPALDEANLDGWRRALAAHHRVVSLHLRGELTDEELRHAEQLTAGVGAALGRRNLCALRGWWLSDAEEWRPARDSLSEAVTLAHKAGKIDRRSEVRLALARYRLGEDDQVQEIADQLSDAADINTHLPLALLWLAGGKIDEAEKYAISAYKHAWADGEPYTHWYECARARAILDQIGAKISVLPRFDAAHSKSLVWEPQVVRAIEAQKSKHQRLSIQKVANEGRNNNAKET